MSDGLQAYCKGCATDYYRQRQEEKGRAVRVKVPVPRGHKRCPQCGEVKAHSEWEQNATSPDGFASYCKVCRAQRNQESYVKRKYGITMAQRDEMISSQMAASSVSPLPPRRWITATRRVGSEAYCASTAIRPLASWGTIPTPCAVPSHTWRETRGSQHS